MNEKERVKVEKHLRESAEIAAMIPIAYDTLNNPDSELMPPPSKKKGPGRPRYAYPLSNLI